MARRRTNQPRVRSRGAPETDSAPAEGDSDSNEQSFSSEYVEKIRREAQGLRDRAKAAESRADELARRLHMELARSSGKLADPTDLAFDADHLDDGDKLGAAIDSLLESKPYLRSRVPSGNVGQGAKDTGQPVSLLSHLKSLV